MERVPRDRTPQDPSDGTLVRQVLDGQRVAFDDLIRRYQRQAVAVSTLAPFGRAADAIAIH